MFKFSSARLINVHILFDSKSFPTSSLAHFQQKIHAFLHILCLRTLYFVKKIHLTDVPQMLKGHKVVIPSFC